MRACPSLACDYPSTHYTPALTNSGPEKNIIIIIIIIIMHFINALWWVWQWEEFAYLMR